jgi:hypothetical protein
MDPKLKTQKFYSRGNWPQNGPKTQNSKILQRGQLTPKEAQNSKLKNSTARATNPKMGQKLKTQKFYSGGNLTQNGPKIGGAFCTPFLFWARGISVRTDQTRPLITPTDTENNQPLQTLKSKNSPTDYKYNITNRKSSPKQPKWNIQIKM